MTLFNYKVAEIQEDRRYFTETAADDEFSAPPHRPPRGDRFDATFANDGASTPTREAIFIDTVDLVLDIDRSVPTLRRRPIVTSRYPRHAEQPRSVPVEGVYLVGRGVFKEGIGNAIYIGDTNKW